MYRCNQCCFLTPVSYTHLTQENVVSPVVLWIPYICFLTPVSYTHLDVYKRQNAILQLLLHKFDEKFNEMTNKIKRQNFKFNKRIDEMHVISIKRKKTL